MRPSVNKVSYFRRSIERQPFQRASGRIFPGIGLSSGAGSQIARERIEIPASNVLDGCSVRQSRDIVYEGSLCCFQTAKLKRY